MMLQKIDKTYWVVLLIIGGITGLTLGFIGPNVIHHLLFKHGDTLFVVTPFYANVLMIIATVFFVLFCIGMIIENKVWNYVGILLLVLSIALGYFAVGGNYNIISRNDITIVKSLTKDVYEWNEISEATYLDEFEYGDRTMHFTFKDGNEETIEISKIYIKFIEQKLTENDIQVN